MAARRVHRFGRLPLLILFSGLLLTFAAIHPAAASMVVAPARLHVEVGPHGATKELTLVNRGESQVTVNTYVGYGTHDEVGGPIYLDDSASRRDASAWIRVRPTRFTLDPGAAARVELQFLPLPGSVSAYPVVFVESRANRALHEEGVASQSRLRIGVPALVTFSQRRLQQIVTPRVRSVSAHALPQSDTLLVNVDVENLGTVHGTVQVELSAVDGDGRRVASADARSGRILPKAVRRFTGRWRLSSLPRALRIVASVGPQGEAAPSLMAIALPRTVESAASGVLITSLNAGLQANGSQLRVSGRLVGADPRAADLLAHLIVYGRHGEELSRTVGFDLAAPEPQGGVTFQQVVSLAPHHTSQVLGVGLDVRAGGVSIGYAATTLEDQPGRTTLSLSTP